MTNTEVSASNCRPVQIPISDLFLDVENPRHDPVADQKLAIRALMAGNGATKLLKLAEDISKAGPNPAELLIVVPSKLEGKFTVIEGNRRLACLKLLEDPNLIEGSEQRAMRRQLERFSKAPRRPAGESLACVCFDTREDANHWLELRHTGEQNGVGVVRWSAAAAERFKKGQSWIALQVIDFARTKGSLDSAIVGRVNKRITNLARLVNDPDVRDALGIRAVDGAVESTAAKQEVTNALVRVVTDVADPAFTVNRIRSKDDRRAYVEGLISSGAIRRPVANSVTGWRLAAGIPSSGRQRGRPAVTKRKAVIPTGCILRPESKRTRQMGKELKGLDAERFPNAAAVILRVFLELCLDEYIQSHQIRIQSGAELKKKIVAVAGDLEGNCKLTKKQTQSARIAASSRNALFSTVTLNSYVHDISVVPKGSNLRETWDDMETFIEALWS